MLMLTLALLGLAAQDASTTAAPSAAADPSQRVKCRSQVETGSLAKRIRTCRTVAEWRKVDEAQRNGAYRAIDQGAISCGDCRRGG